MAIGWRCLAGNPTAEAQAAVDTEAQAADSSEAQAAVDTHELELKNAMDDLVVLKPKHAELSDGRTRWKKLATAAAKFVAAATN